MHCMFLFSGQVSIRDEEQPIYPMKIEEKSVWYASDGQIREINDDSR